MRPTMMTIEPRTPTECSDIPYAIQISSSGPYANCDEQGIRVAAWGAGLCSCLTHLVPNCYMVTLCPCVSLAQITSRLSLYRFKTVLCGLLSVAIVQLLAAVAAFAQVHNSGQTSQLKTYYSRKPSWWSQASNKPPSGGAGFNSQGLSDDDDDDVASSAQGGTSFASDILAMMSNPWGVLCLLLGLVYILVAWRLRLKIRARFLIRGSWLLDLLVSLLLPCCSIAQMATHVKSYKPGKCGFGPADVLPPYPLIH